ncbi:MAG: amidohydrolase family protein [Alphaproteobacteria bacterium]|nr:amidohydrolase family protein [Alphaproteobacteria bacterium]
MDPTTLNALSDGRRAVSLVHGRIIDGTTREPIDDGFVTLAEGRVAAVGAMGDQRRGDADAVVIDLGGKTVLPGLIDCHAHLVYRGFRSLEDVDRCTVELGMVNAILNAEALIGAGYTTVRDVGTIGNVAATVRDAIVAGRIAGPRVVASGQAICPTAGFADNLPAHWHGEHGFGAIANGPWEFVKEVRRQIKTGVDNIKIGASGVEVGPYAHSWMTTVTQEELTAAVGEAHRRGRTVAVHCQSYDSVKYSLRAGADTIEHGTRLDDEAVDLFRASDAILVPTLCTLFSVLQLGDKLNLLPKQRSEMAVNEALWLGSLRQAREAGIPIAAGGDIGNRFPHGTNARELEYLVSQGFTAHQAIIAATGTAARALRRERFIGTLAPGRFADLVVLDGDPLADIRQLQDQMRIAMVFKSARLVAGMVRQHLGLGRAETQGIGIDLLGERWRERH